MYAHVITADDETAQGRQLSQVGRNRDRRPAAPLDDRSIVRRVGGIKSCGSQRDRPVDNQVFGICAGLDFDQIGDLGGVNCGLDGRKVFRDSQHGHCLSLSI